MDTSYEVCRAQTVPLHWTNTQYEVGGRWLASFPGSFQQRAKTAARLGADERKRAVRLGLKSRG